MIFSAKTNILILAVILFLHMATLLATGKTEDPKNPVVIIKTDQGDIYVELFPKEAPKTVENFIDLATGKKEFKDPDTGKKTKRPYYDGLVFHRVIKNFMIQGGCPHGTGTGGPGYKFEDEINGKSLGLDKLQAFKNNIPHPWLGIKSQDDFIRAIQSPIIRKLKIKSQKEFQKRKAEVESELDKFKKLNLLQAYEYMGYKFSDKLKSRPPKRGVLAMANSGPNTNGSQFFINIIDTPWLTAKHTVFGNVVKGMDIVDKISNLKAEPGASKPKVKIISIRLVKAK